MRDKLLFLFCFFSLGLFQPDIDVEYFSNFKIVDRGYDIPDIVTPETRLTLVTPHGFELQEWYISYLSRGEIHRHYVDLSHSPAQERLNKRATLEIENEKDLLQDLLSMAFLIYPSNNLFYSIDDSTVRAAKQNLYNEVTSLFTTYNFSVTDIFSGNRYPSQPLNDIGVHSMVFYHPALNKTAIAFQGASSNADYVQAFIWWAPFIIFDVPQRGIDRWLSINNSLSELTYRNLLVAMFDRVEFNLGFSSEKSSFESSVEKFGLTSTEASTGAYYYLAQSIVANVMQERNLNQDNMILTGHSLGASLATLTSMNLESQGLFVPTYGFSTPGTQCLARSLGIINSNIDRSHLRHYFSLYDNINLIDRPIGTTCPFLQDLSPVLIFGGTTVEHDCAPSVGFGIELALSRYLEYQQCNRRAHDFFAIYETLFLINTTMNENGTVELGCSTAEWLESCPTFSEGADYYIFIAFLILVIIVIPLALIIFGIATLIRCIFLRCYRKSDAPIFPCCKCCYCRGCCGGDELECRSCKCCGDSQEDFEMH